MIKRKIPTALYLETYLFHICMQNILIVNLVSDKQLYICKYSNYWRWNLSFKSGKLLFLWKWKLLSAIQKNRSLFCCKNLGYLINLFLEMPATFFQFFLRKSTKRCLHQNSNVMWSSQQLSSFSLTLKYYSLFKKKNIAKSVKFK